MPPLAKRKPHLLPISERIQRLQTVLRGLQPVPAKWFLSAATGHGRVVAAPEDMGLLPCTTFRALLNEWRKALKMTDGLDCALSVMLATGTSTMAPGEQLWFKIIGPPSTGKTTLLEGLATDTAHVYSKDTIKGVHTGDQRAHDGNKDLSLIGMAASMTFAVKDADTLLKMPNKEQILSEFRGLYDRTSRTHYRNTVMKDYTNVRMTQLWCGTSALREIDQSELGARFLDCVVMEQIDEEHEHEVGWRAANQELRNIMMQTTADVAEAAFSPEETIARNMSGGYLYYLRSNIRELLLELDVQCEQSQLVLKRCQTLGMFIAYMRARPVKDRENDREFSARLIKQITRLATYLAIVLNRTTLDEEVLRRTTKVAVDTSQGLSLTLLKLLYTAPDGMDIRAMELASNIPYGVIRTMLRFLKRLGVVEQSQQVDEHGAKTKHQCWVLTAKLRTIYKEVSSAPTA